MEPVIFSLAFFLQILLGDEAQSGGVHTIAEATGRRAIIEDMARWESRYLPRTSVRTLDRRRSSRVTMLPGSRGLIKLGHPVLESYLSRELNSGSPETIST
jgi:hypothetical protein